MNRRSVRFRLTAWYAAVLALTLAIAGVGVWFAIKDSINDSVDRDLRARLHGMRDYLQRQMADAEVGSLAQELAEDSAVAPAGTDFRIAGTDGHWVYQSPGSVAWDAPNAASLPAEGSVTTVVLNGRATRLLSAPVPIGTIQIGIPLDAFHDMLSDFAMTALIGTPLLLLLASAGGYWMSRRALDPVDRIRRTAEEIGAATLSERLPVIGTGDELDRLSVTLNSMLGRIESAFHRVTQFTADASHELRTPVAVIRTTAELARSKPRTQEEYAAALDRILAESERTTRLIEDLMMLARADSGNDDLVFEPVNLDDLVRATCAEMAVIAEAARLEIDTGTLVDCIVQGDEPSLRRLLLILLDNAIKYSKPSGRVRVSMSLHQSAAGKNAVMEVADMGIGISADDLPHIFERFYRAAKDRSRRTGGAGLGLAIARWIAERHGGSIQAESTIGCGSVFRVSLPAIP